MRNHDVPVRTVRCSCCGYNRMVIPRAPRLSPDPRCYDCRLNCPEGEHRE